MFGRLNAYTYFADRVRLTGIEEGAALAYVGVAASVIGAGVTAYSAVQSSDAAAKAAQYNSEVAQQNAIAANQQAQQDEQIQQAQSRQLLGAQAAAYGGSGVTPEGSPLDVLGSTASNAELTRQTIAYKASLKAAGYTDESQLDQASALTDATTGEFKASAALIAGVGNAASKLPKGNSDGTGTSTTFGSNGGP